MQHDKEHMARLVEEYSVKKNAKEIAIRENICVGTLYWYIRKAGKSQSKRKYFINELYFDKIDTQEKAYFLGFIMADGLVCKTDDTQNRTNRLVVNISYKDRCVLEWFLKDSEATYPIKDYVPHESTYSNNMMSVITINSQKLCSGLKRFGITPSKTGKEKIPWISKKMKPHFLRGFFDGDGSVMVRKDGHNTVTFSSCNRAILDEIVDILRRLGAIGSCAIRPDDRGKHAYSLVINTQSDIQKLYSYMYKDVVYCLDRKKHLFNIQDTN